MGRAKSINIQIHPRLGIRKKLTNIRDTRFTDLSFRVRGKVVYFSNRIQLGFAGGLWNNFQCGETIRRICFPGLINCVNGQL